jgi:hypothetical protein
MRVDLVDVCNLRQIVGEVDDGNTRTTIFVSAAAD